MHPRASPWRPSAVGLALVTLVLALSSTSFGAIGATAPSTVLPGHGFPNFHADPSQQLADARSALPVGFSLAGAHVTVSTTSSVGVWANVTAKVGAGPSGRLAIMAWDASDGYVLLYGGVILGCGGACYITDTWTYSNGAWTNITASVTGTPPATELPGLAFDPSTGKVILFGGILKTGSSVATWAYEAKTWTNISATVGSTPPATIAPVMVTDSTDGEIILAGGSYATSTWVFKSGTWSNVTATAGSSGRLNLPTGSDDPPEHGVLLFGTWLSNSTKLATLVYSGGTWHNITSTLSVQAPGMLLAGAAYLANVHAVVAYGGDVFNASGGEVLASVTWEFAGGVWTNITDLTGTQPLPYIAWGTAADPNSEAIVLFGGEDAVGPELSPYTYVLSGPAIVTASASKAVLDAGMSDSLTAVVAGGLAPNTVSWSFGDGSVNATGNAVSHTYANPGPFEATVTVTSFVGVTASASVTVFVNPMLSVTENVSASPNAGSAASFSAVLVGGTGPFTYAWTFGDTSATSTSSAPNPTHTYSSSGTFTATVKVIDSAGANVTKTLSVVVGSAPSTSASLASGTGLGLLLGIIVLLVVVVALAVMLMRKPKSPVMMAPTSPPVAPYTPPPPPPPTA